MKSIEIVLYLGLLGFVCAQPAAPARRDPPKTLFGKSIDNEFAYFSDAQPAAEYLNYSLEEAAYANSVLAGQSLAAQRRNLNQEFLRDVPKGNEPVHRVYGNYEYYSVQSGNYPIWFRQHVGRPELGEQLVLDENKLAARIGVTQVFTVGVLVPNSDGSVLAVGVDTTGSSLFDVYFFVMPQNFAQDTYLLNTHVPRVFFQLEWGCNNHTVYFRTQDPTTGIANQVHTYDIKTGTNTSSPFFACPATEQVLLTLTETSTTMLAACDASTGNTVYSMNLTSSCNAFTTLLPAKANTYTYVSQHTGGYLILTNNGAPNYKIMSATAADIATPEKWNLTLAEDPTIVRLQVSAFASRVVVWERATDTGALSLRVLTLEPAKFWRITTALPETVLEPAQGYGVDQYGRANFNLFKSFHFTDPFFLFLSQSLRNPIVTLSVDLTEEESEPTLFDEDVVQSYNPAQYQTQRIYVPSGAVSVPVTLVFAKLSCDNILACPPYHHPLLLDAYGVYGKTLDPIFNYRLLSLLHRGFIFAVAHVRGGAMRGPGWHTDATGVNKQRSIDDYLAVVDYLLALNITTPSSLVVTGLGPGAMLPLAVLTAQRTRNVSLARTALLRSPDVNLVNNLLSSSNATQLLTEFGNPYADEATLTAQLAVDQYQLASAIANSSISSTIFISAKSRSYVTVQKALQLSALLRKTGAPLQLVVLAGLPSPLADQDYSSELAYVLEQVGRSDAAAGTSASSDLPGWAIGIIVLSTFAAVLIVVWVGIRHRNMIKDLFFLRVRNTAATYTTPESESLLARSSEQNI
eukprot:m.227995 g.227995  ORF g.227995 m.227995 type:complete len:802 (-) comp17376_c0_seq1:26-2431(-)